MEVRPEKWKFLQDEPCAQVIGYIGNRIPSFLPKYRKADHNRSAEYGYRFRVAEAAISRKAECIVITWCSTIMTRSDGSTRQLGPPAVSFYVYRGGKLALESRIPLPRLMYSIFEVNIFCVTLRRKHCVVEAVKPGDRLCVFTDWCNYVIRVSEANVCVVYNRGGHLLLEVNSELLSKDESQELEEQFGELVLNQKSRGK
jgi:hypothetical protein